MRLRPRRGLRSPRGCAESLRPCVAPSGRVGSSDLTSDLTSPTPCFAPMPVRSATLKCPARHSRRLGSFDDRRDFLSGPLTDEHHVAVRHISVVLGLAL